ncbi:MAG: HAD hydrolase-like protein [Myxococcales bacterium]|nr:HAD hydrolase-like protein [Myxococcales bacterium]
MKRHLFIFDIDGTLVLSGGVGRDALERAVLKHYGLTDPFDGYHFHGKTDPQIVSDMHERHGLGPVDAAQMRVVLDDYLVELAALIGEAPRYRVLSGVREWVEELAARDPRSLGLATGNLLRGAELKLVRGDLWRYFRFGGFSSDHPDRQALTRLAVARGYESVGERVPPERTFVIGDTPEDVRCALGAEATPVGVTTGRHSADELRAAGCELVFDSMRAVAAHFNGSGLVRR